MVVVVFVTFVVEEVVSVVMVVVEGWWRGGGGGSQHLPALLFATVVGVTRSSVENKLNLCANFFTY